MLADVHYSLLDLTRLQTVEYMLNMERFDICELMGDALMSARQRFF